MSERAIAARTGTKRLARVPVVFEVANYADIGANERGTLADEDVRRVRLSGFVDPQVTKMVLPRKVVKQLGLWITGEVSVTSRNGAGMEKRHQVEGAFLTLQGRSGTYQAVVDEKRALIGRIVLDDLDFLVDCQNNRLVPRDPSIVTTDIE